MGSNNIGDEGTKRIAEMLENNNTITSLDLDCNDIGDEGAKCIAVMLKINKTLTSLNLANNDIDQEITVQIAEALNKNQQDLIELKRTAITLLMLRKRKECLLFSVPKGVICQIAADCHPATQNLDTGEFHRFITRIP